MNSYLVPEYREYDHLYEVLCTKQYQNGVLKQNCLYTRNIIQPYQYSKLFKYYVYLRKGTRNKIDGISTEIKDGCVGTILCANPIRIPRGTFTPAHGYSPRFVGVHLDIESDPLTTDDDISPMESIIDDFRLEALNVRDDISVNIVPFFDRIKYYRFDDDHDATIKFCESTKGSHRVAEMIGKEVGSKFGSIMATAHCIKTNKPKCFTIKYVWVDENGVFDYRGAIDDNEIIFDYEFLGEEMTLTELQYNSIVKKWKNKWPNR